MTTDALTPVQFRAGFFFKREDTFHPLKHTSANGSKLRQCLNLIRRHAPTGLVSYASIHSPQLVHVAACGRSLRLPVVLHVGGLRTTPGILEAMRLGARVVRHACARHPTLHRAAVKSSTDGDLLIPHGMIGTDDLVAQVDIGSWQVKNVPHEAECLVIPCGSGLSSLAVLFGIARFSKPVRRIWVITTGYSRLSFIRLHLRNLLKEKYPDRSQLPPITEVELGRVTSFRYERPASFEYGGIRFHPLYEAKAFRWAIQNLELKPRRTLFWIVGGC
jgi:1-aminocyclopropane-1-carboxylate deaminase/D-cysteine desulfhydrase-like pyridoxal-dependent ACC family enzyme